MVAVWSFSGGWQCGELGCIFKLWVFIEMASECMDDFCGGVKFVVDVWKTRVDEWDFGEMGLEAINTISEGLEDLCWCIRFLRDKLRLGNKGRCDEWGLEAINTRSESLEGSCGGVLFFSDIC